MSFSEIQPLQGVRLETAKAAQVVAMLFEGVGINAISRLTLLNKKTVLNVLETAGAHCESLLSAKIRNIRTEQVEIDEVHSFVGRRPHFVEAKDPARGAFYCFL